jgi:hypothetical protein
MRYRFTKEDVADAPHQHWPLIDTDLEINANVRGDDVIVRVNKNGILVFRVLLEGAGKDIDDQALANFSTFAPDFVFKVGDSQAGMERLKKSLGVA